MAILHVNEDYSHTFEFIYFYHAFSYIWQNFNLCNDNNKLKFLHIKPNLNLCNYNSQLKFFYIKPNFCLSQSRFSHKMYDMILIFLPMKVFRSIDHL